MRTPKLVLTAAVAAAVLMAAPAAAPAANTDLLAKDGRWRDTAGNAVSTVTVATGDSVTWAAKLQADGGDESCHNIVVTQGDTEVDRFPAAGCERAWTRTKTFDAAGTYTFLCEPHQRTMKGTLVVGSGGGSTTPPEDDTPSNDTPPKDDTAGTGDTPVKEDSGTKAEVDSGTGPAPTTQIAKQDPAAGTPASGPADTAPPGVQAVVKRALSLRGVLSKGIVQRLALSEPARIETKAYIPASVAKRLKIRAAARREVLVGKAAKSVATAGIVKLRVRFGKAAAKRLRRARSVKVVLRTTVTDSAGNVKTITSRVRLSG